MERGNDSTGRTAPRALGPGNRRPLQDLGIFRLGLARRTREICQIVGASVDIMIILWTDSRARFGGEATKHFPEIFTRGFTKHITLSPHPPSVLESPATEVMFAFFPTDFSQTDKDAASAQFQQFVDKALKQCPDVTSVSSGWGVESDFPVRGGEEGQKGSLLTALIGWSSVDAHMRFRETDVFKDNVGLIRSLRGLVKLAMFHVSCRTLERR